MTINGRQKVVLVACAAVVAAMLVYPPLQFRGLGRGFGWLFAMRPGETVNATQLLVQWVGVALIGAIAFVLAGAPQRVEGESAGTPFAARARAAFRASRPWLWILLAMVGVAVVLAPDAKSAAMAGMGKLGAAALIYVAVFGWHMVRAQPDGMPPAAAPARTNWKRVAVYVAVAAAALAWIGYAAQRWPDSSGQPNPFDEFDEPAEKGGSSR